MYSIRSDKYGKYSASVDDGLSAVLDSFGLVQLTQDSNVLDVLATAPCEAITDVRTDDVGCISDHRLVRAKIGCSKPAHQTVASTYCNVRKIDIASFERALRQSALVSSRAP